MKVGLQWKAIGMLLAIAALPLVVSALVVKQVALVAQSVAVGEAERLHAALDRAKNAYVEALDARKEAFKRAADAAAESPALLGACEADDPRPALEKIVAADPELGGIVLHRGMSKIEVEEDLTLAGPWRALRQDRTVSGGCSVELTYVTTEGAQLFADHEKLGEVLREHKTLEKIRQDLPPSYRTAFLWLVGSVGAITTLVAILVARRYTRRIDRLVASTRKVAAGDLTARAKIPGRDELADLGHAFDEMVADIADSRGKIEYLEKIGAWQEVARRLAHEIKNPLTPIQLAVQQLASKYKGDDEKFKRMLEDVKDIVGEEVAGLRRLVDAFSGFAKLPRVEPKPIDLAAVVEDAVRDDPTGELAVELDAPPSPATARGDRLLLRRVLANLLENARQAGAKRARVAWRVVDDDRCHLTVDDDGPGVPADLREKIFDPYMTTKPHGTGLGLAIAKKTILEHGGTIELDTAPSPLGGARFLLDLPAVTSTESPAAPSDPSSRASAS
jgi:nitrogen fixation/metabolism regulation signal transduction histidine kinase